MPSERLLLFHEHSPGDVLVLTALARDIHRAYPGRFTVGVQTSCLSLWQHNPHVQTAHLDRTACRWLRMVYGKGIKRSQQGERYHFLRAFHDDFQRQTGLTVPLTEPRPDLHFSPEEERRLIPGPYWVVVAGGKMDFTAKHWVYQRYQEIVETLRQLGLRFVQLGDRAKGPPAHYHPNLTGVLNLVGQTSLREALRIIKQAEGVICGVTFAMHAAAALEKPCIVLAGGREAPWWEEYSNRWSAFGPDCSPVKVEHRFLDTLNLLDCCQNKGCWKNKVTASEGHLLFCKKPVPSREGQVVPLCQDMIKVEDVVAAVLSYYADGTLSDNSVQA